MEKIERGKSFAERRYNTLGGVYDLFEKAIEKFGCKKSIYEVAIQQDEEIETSQAVSLT